MFDMRIAAIAYKLQYAAPVVKYQYTHNTTAFVNVSNILLLFVYTFDGLTHKITPSINNVCQLSTFLSVV